MKKIITLFTLSLIVFTGSAQGSYTTSDLQMIFSFANVKENGNEITSPMRWSPVFNLGTNYHKDFSQGFGGFVGLNIKNIGFIANTSTGKEIHRTYNFGIPVGIKLGNMDRQFIYLGYELEIPFNYKFKAWDSSDRSGVKTSFNTWFSDATPSTMNTLFFGIQFYKGLNLKFKYYMEDFLNQDYMRDGVMPNADLEARVFSVSIVSSFLRGRDFFYDWE